MIRYASFSMGRTSAFMVHRELERGFDGLVICANTGKEREESLAFGDECARRWGVRIHVIEYEASSGFREVTFATASRHGEPMAAVIANRGYLPHPGNPFCSTETKFRPARHFMRSLGYDEWDALIGLRADERARVAKLEGRKVEGGWAIMPLAEDGLTLADVDAFWKKQPFDLRLHPHEGNCDLCWKKSGAKIGGLIDQDPERATWWAEQERATGTRWRNDRPTYAALQDAAKRQVRLPLLDDGGEPCSLCA